MSRRLLRFIRLLRAHGVPVSVAESLDALHSVAQLGVEERDLLRLTLRTTLVKSQHQFATFDALFERFFTIPRRRKRRRQRRPGTEHGAGQQPAAAANGQLPRPPSQAPPPAAAARRPLPREVCRSKAETGGADVLSDTLNDLEQSWQRQLEGQPLPLSPAAPHAATGTLVYTRIDREFPPDQLPHIYREVERLATRLLSRRALRYRRATHGQVDLRRTMTRSLRSGNETPFALTHRRRRIGKHRLLVMCDVSGSVWQVSTFLLKLVHTLQAEFSSVRSLLFVNSMVEVTPLFRHMRFPDDLDDLRHYPNLNLFGFSDFGRAFYQVYRDLLGDLSRDTVFLILGDARNNGFDPQAWTLGEMRQRCRRMLWLNPEPQQQWNSGDSVLAAYAPYCDHILPCWTLDHLAQAADLLLRQ